MTRPEAHVRHAGLMIDASFRKNGTVEYYVVEKGQGRFATLEIAKEIAEHRAAVRTSRPSLRDERAEREYAQYHATPVRAGRA